jgi:hypothetical protein
VRLCNRDLGVIDARRRFQRLATPRAQLHKASEPADDSARTEIILGLEDLGRRVWEVVCLNWYARLASSSVCRLV